jgi:hypothetical protein
MVDQPRPNRLNCALRETTVLSMASKMKSSFFPTSSASRLLAFEPSGIHILSAAKERLEEQDLHCRRRAAVDRSVAPSGGVERIDDDRL